VANEWMLGSSWLIVLGHEGHGIFHAQDVVSVVCFSPLQTLEASTVHSRGGVGKNGRDSSQL